MMSILGSAIQKSQEADLVFTKFITPNETGSTGSNQGGFLIPKNAWQLFFEEPGIKGSNKDIYITIKWQDDFETRTRCTYYGSKTRNEYRLTRFGRNFPFLTDDNVGNLLIITKSNPDFYQAYVLETEDDFEAYFAALHLSSTETNKLISKRNKLSTEDQLQNCYSHYINLITSEFPSTIDIANNARNCFNSVNSITNKDVLSSPDKYILNWLTSEFDLFKAFENQIYLPTISKQFTNVEELIITANTVLNRRKSRAGKSLEHHLTEIFKVFRLQFSTQAITEDNKKPDFLFPGKDEYQNSLFDEKKLISLASKTTCKDRWRQILNEADRIKVKHLFTLQQGISKNQLTEMYKHNVCLIVPKPYLKSFPKEFRDKILTLNKFIQRVKSTQAI